MGLANGFITMEQLRGRNAEFWDIALGTKDGKLNGLAQELRKKYLGITCISKIKTMNSSTRWSKTHKICGPKAKYT